MVLGPEAALLTDRVAVVTGGASGLGRAIADAFGAFGARVAVWDKADPHHPVDVRDPDQVDGAMARTIASLGVPTILINNAGGVFRSSLLDTSPNGWDALIRANLSHVLLCTQRVARAMRDAGVGGSIVNVASIEGLRAAPGYAAYAAAKAGVLNLTQTAALELAPLGIRVNALAPDVILTEGLRSLVTDSVDHLGAMVPLGRPGEVDELAGAAVFLASDLSSYITGQILGVDGGTGAAGGWYRHPDDGHYILGPASGLTGS
jgi:NAD(P)-dependent dehydrogenase (short-subunit alcohol dehydrogenase family)